MRDVDWIAAMKEAKREGDLAPRASRDGPRYPDWIVLARRAFISDRQNAAVAVAGRTSNGNPIEVSLFAADPPAVSHLRVHCPGREVEFSHNPAVIFSRDDLILFDVCLRGGVSDYFIYRAHSKNPSLLLIPDPAEPCSSGLGNTGIVRCGADHFAVAALYWDKGLFMLTVFSNRTGAWTTRVAPVEPSEWVTKNHINVLGFKPTKVIPLKGSLLGWVDVWGGIMFCDVLSDDPKLHYIPMPEPMPGNLQHKGESAYFRDVIGCGEVIKFVEVEYDDDDDDDEEPDYKWIAMTRSRKLDSREWGRAHEVSSEDVTVSEDFHGWFDLLPDKLCVNGKPFLKKMPVGLPTLCEFNSVMYLMCKLMFWDSKGWVLAQNRRSWNLLPGFLHRAPLVSSQPTIQVPSQNTLMKTVQVFVLICITASNLDDSPVRLSYEPYFFSERIVFFSHNKSANSTFSYGLLAKRTCLSGVIYNINGVKIP